MEARMESKIELEWELEVGMYGENEPGMKVEMNLEWKLWVELIGICYGI